MFQKKKLYKKTKPADWYQLAIFNTVNRHIFMQANFNILRRSIIKEVKVFDIPTHYFDAGRVCL